MTAQRQRRGRRGAAVELGPDCTVCREVAFDRYIFGETTEARCPKCGTLTVVGVVEFTPEMADAFDRIYFDGDRQRGNEEVLLAVMDDPELFALSKWLGVEIEARRGAAPSRGARTEEEACH